MGLRCNKTTNPVTTNVITLQVTAHLALLSALPRVFFTPTADPMVMVEKTKKATHSLKRELRDWTMLSPVS
jgi:hypothetical protein